MTTAKLRSNGSGDRWDNREDVARRYLGALAALLGETAERIDAGPLEEAVTLDGGDGIALCPLRFLPD